MRYGSNLVLAIWALLVLSLALATSAVLAADQVATDRTLGAFDHQIAPAALSQAGRIVSAEIVIPDTLNAEQANATRPDAGAVQMEGVSIARHFDQTRHASMHRQGLPVTVVSRVGSAVPSASAANRTKLHEVMLHAKAVD